MIVNKFLNQLIAYLCFDQVFFLNFSLISYRNLELLKNTKFINHLNFYFISETKIMQFNADVHGKNLY
jgi:hypothetical protein